MNQRVKLTVAVGLLLAAAQLVYPPRTYDWHGIGKSHGRSPIWEDTPAHLIDEVGPEGPKSYHVGTRIDWDILGAWLGATVLTTTALAIIVSMAGASFRDVPRQ